MSSSVRPSASRTTKDKSPTQKGSVGAIVRSATHNLNGASSKTVTFSLERLKWNQGWSHGTDEPIWLSPQIRWEIMLSGGPSGPCESATGHRTCLSHGCHG